MMILMFPDKVRVVTASEDYVEIPLGEPLVWEFEPDRTWLAVARNGRMVEILQDADGNLDLTAYSLGGEDTWDHQEDQDGEGSIAWLLS